MTNKLRLATTALLASSLLLSSCAEVSKVLENSDTMTKFGVGGGAIIGGIIGGDKHRNEGAALGALSGAGLGWLASKAYTASTNQQRYAQEKANQALVNNRSVMNSVKNSNARYVAVPVKADKDGGKSKSGIVRVKVREKKDGTLEATGTDSKIYDSVSGKSGSTVKVAGADAVYYNP